MNISDIQAKLAALFRQANDIRREIDLLIGQLPEHERECWDEQMVLSDAVRVGLRVS